MGDVRFGSEPVRVIEVPELSWAMESVWPLAVGGGTTVRVNWTLLEFTPPLAVPPESVTVTVIVAVPDWPAIGARLRVPVEFGLV